MTFYSFYSFLKLITKDKNFNQHYMFVIKCNTIHPVSSPTTQKLFPFVNKSFINNTLPYKKYLSTQIKTFWYPKTKYQQLTINSLIQAGPFVTKYTNITNSTDRKSTRLNSSHRL